MTEAGAVSDAAVRELAAEILERSEYAAHRRDPTFLQRWVDALSDWLDRQAEVVAGWIPDWMAAAWNGFWDGLSGMLESVFGEDALAVVLRLAVAAFVLGAFGILLHRVLRELRSAREEGAGEGAPAVAPGPRWMEEADRLAGQSRFLEAAHCTQLAALQLLLDKRLLELERSDPNRTLRRRLRDAPVPEGERARFLELLDRLEGAWFRDRREDATLYRDWRSLHGRIRSLPEARALP